MNKISEKTRRKKGYINCVHCGTKLTGASKRYCSNLCSSAHAREVRRKNSSINQQDFREFVLERDNFTCQDCRERLNTWELHCHHVIPLYKGGADSVDNCTTLCHDCHKKVHKVM